MPCSHQRIWSPRLSLSGGVEFDGVTVVQDFLTHQEEKELIEAIDQQPWVESQSGRRKQVQTRHVCDVQVFQKSISTGLWAKGELQEA